MEHAVWFGLLDHRGRLMRMPVSACGALMIVMTLLILLLVVVVTTDLRHFGLVVKASASRAGFESGIFRGRVIPVTSKLTLQWQPCQAPGVIGSVLGLVGPVSVYCEWMRWKV